MILTIDPGSVTMGYAIWSENGVRASKEQHKLVAPPIKIGSIVIRQPPETITERAKCITDRLRHALGTDFGVITNVYVEIPRIFTSTARGGAAVDDVMEVMFVCGYLCMYFDNAVFHEVPVLTWKGNMPKNIVIDRVERKLRQFPDTVKKLGTATHGWDAVGIGLWMQGLI